MMIIIGMPSNYWATRFSINEWLIEWRLECDGMRGGQNLINGHFMMKWRKAPCGSENC